MSWQPSSPALVWARVSGQLSACSEVLVLWTPFQDSALKASNGRVRTGGREPGQQWRRRISQGRGDGRRWFVRIRLDKRGYLPAPRHPRTNSFPGSFGVAAEFSFSQFGDPKWVGCRSNSARKDTRDDPPLCGSVARSILARGSIAYRWRTGIISLKCHGLWFALSTRRC